MAAITTIQRAGTGSGAGRVIRRLGPALSAVGARFVAWAAPLYDGGIGEELEGLPSERRIQAVLRWHARESRGL